MTIKAHFDGKVFVPDEPVDLPPGAVAVVEPRESAKNYMTARELLDILNENPQIADTWNAIAAGRDSTTLVNDLRWEAAKRQREIDTDNSGT